MDKNLLKYLAFVKTVESGSFTRAAEALHYAQSSVSKMVADLEKEWGMTLLERSRNGLSLTSSGEQILPFVRTVLRDFEALEHQIGELQGVKRGIVRIGTFSSVAIHWLPNIFARFQRDYPGIEYEMLLGDYEEVEQWIEEGRVDCGFLRLPTRPGFETISLKKDEYKVVLPPDHALAKKTVIDIKELEGQPFLLLEHGGKTEVSELLEASHVSPQIRFTTWEDFAVMSMVEKGLGIGILPDLILKRIPYEIAVRPLTVPYYREIGLARKQAAYPAPAVRIFMEYLKYREERVGF